QSTVILEDNQYNTDESILEPGALIIASSADIAPIWLSTNIKVNNYLKNLASMQPHSTNIKVNGYQKNAINLTNDDKSVLEPDALMTAISADISQENTSTCMKNKFKKRNSTPKRLHSTNIKNHQNIRNLENN
ncbi:11090_t:CDS:2, partial [Racocetra fulgida]